MQRRVSTLRMVLAAVKDKDIAARTETSREGMSDDDVLSLLAKMIKQREDSITAFVVGNRPELADAEREEIAIIRDFMPMQMSADEAKAAAADMIAELGAASMKDMGKVMAALKERYAGQMDFAQSECHGEGTSAKEAAGLPVSAEGEGVIGLAQRLRVCKWVLPSSKSRHATDRCRYRPPLSGDAGIAPAYPDRG